MDYADKIEADSWARRADWQLSEGRGRGLGEKGEGIKQRKKKIKKSDTHNSVARAEEKGRWGR